MSKRFKLVTSLVFLLTGCAQLQVTYTSDPPGATLYQEGRPIGRAPYTLTYGGAEVQNAFKNGQCTQLSPITARWASGASASSGMVTACPRNGLQQHLTLVRPDVPGREVDAQFALQLELGRQQLQLQQQQNQIQAQRNAILQQQQQQQQQLLFQQTQPRQINCTSNQVGTYVYTNCR